MSILASEFENLGFETLVTKQENNCVHLRVNVKNEEEAERRKNAYCIQASPAQHAHFVPGLQRVG